MIRIHCRSVCLAPSPSSSPFSPSCSDAGHSRGLQFLAFSAKLPNPLSHDLVWNRRLRRRRPVFSCGSFNRSPDGGGIGRDDDSEQFLQASLLVPETVRHYNLWKHGFVEETKWNSPGLIHPLSLQARGAKADDSSIGHGFLRRFQNPTIFLKIACDGDLLLPIIVGEIAISKLIDSLRDDRHEECPDQYEFIKKFVGKLGYEVQMVRITERVVNAYYARILLGKPAERANINIDARPSDAINVAERFKAPIYVSKQIVIKDAIKVVYGTWRAGGVKTIYDVSLDSAAEGPDAVAEELDLVKKMNSAVLEERYKDAVILRDKLSKLRMPRDEF